MPGTICLRPDQEEDIPRVRDALRRNRRVLLQRPTGTGKTALFCAAADRDGEQAMRSRDPAPLLPQPARTGTDWHPTPPCLTLALTRFVLPGLPPGPVWEPCAGDGRLARAIEAEGRQVIATDIAPRCAAVARHDLRADPPAGTAGASLVTNLPWDRALLDPLIGRGLMLLDSGVLQAMALLLRPDKLFAGSRADAFNRAAELWQCSWRPVWIEGSTRNPRWAAFWAVWRRNYAGPPVTRFLRYSDLVQRRLDQ
jgi:hypothetical protein